MKTEQQIDNMKKHARAVVKEIFKEYGLDPYRKVGLQTALQDELVKAALHGQVDLKWRK